MSSVPLPTARKWQVVEISEAEWNTPFTVDHDTYDVNALWITWADSETEAADLVDVLRKHGKYAIVREAPLHPQVHDPNPYALLHGAPNSRTPSRGAW